ncbi:MAG: Cell death protease [Caeruleum heppii]|nr:MAG: Cell death protease [Caeruleum heppii]
MRCARSSWPSSNEWGMIEGIMRWSVLLCLLGPSGVLALTAADYFVHSLPGQPEGPLLKMHAGHIEVDPEHNANLFFWHYQNRHIGDRQRTVIWLNGGPGCSSEDGGLMEIGPYRVDKDGNLRYNDGSWDEFANLLFVDNPVGTGFSYVSTDSYLHELDEMADQFIVFLEKFFALFPQFESDDLYLAGESYAGQHIPYIAKAILERNKGPNVRRKWLLEGLLIGNGWISPLEQYMSYLQFAYKEGVVQGGSDQAKMLESQQAICTSKLNAAGGLDHVDIADCEEILQSILRLTRTEGEHSQCVNMYDVRLKDVYPSCGMNWPPDLATVTPYLRKPEVVQALHVDPAKKAGWQECSGAVGSAFTARKSKPSVQILPELLSQVRVLLFSGDKDMICNHIGTEELINNLSWNGGKGFEISPGTWAPRRDWTFEGEAAGIYQEARNLTYVLFYNSSHMVPFDYPRRTRDMLDRFLEVDIASIGGTPADSRLDGEKGLETSVGGHPNSTVAEQEAAEKLKQVKWAAYYKSGETALVIVIIAAAAWGWYVYRDRRKRAGYRGLFGGHPLGSGREGNGHISFGHMPSPRDAQHHSANGNGFEAFRHKRTRSRGDEDLEAADFDENELDDLHVASPREDRPGGGGVGSGVHVMDADRYSLGGVSDSDDDDGEGDRLRGRAEEKRPDR